MWYVALTRAKRVLGVPPKFIAVVRAFCLLHDYAAFAIHGADAMPEPGLSPDSTSTMDEDLGEIKRQAGLKLVRDQRAFSHHECMALFNELVSVWEKEMASQGLSIHDGPVPMTRQLL